MKPSKLKQQTPGAAVNSRHGKSSGVKRLPTNWVLATGAVFIFLAAIVAWQIALPGNSIASNEDVQARLHQVWGQFPLSFEANQGQTDPDVQFVARGQGYGLFLKPTEAVLALQNNGGADSSVTLIDNQESTMGPPTLVRMQFEGANPSAIASAVDQLPGKTNYFIGNDPDKWHTNIPNYAKVLYRDVYPGVDLVYYGNQRQLEYDFVVAPGADPGAISLVFEGAKQLSLDEKSNLVVQVAGGDIVLLAPIVYQELDGVRHEVPGRYLLDGAAGVAFEVGDYDQTLPLVIDPILSYSSFLGGFGQDQGTSIAVDGNGNAYVAGHTVSNNFPVSSPTYDSARNGSWDAFVSKINPAGSALLYSTYIGGSTRDLVGDIAVDASGNAYISGSTLSSDFPTTAGVLGEVPAGVVNANGVDDVFVTKLNPSGTGLVYSTYLGGTGDDQNADLAIDTAGNAYVTGNTTSSNFPMVNGFQTTNFGGFDSFVAKLNPNATAVLYSSFMGGGSFEAGSGIAVDNSGLAHITGQTQSGFGFPVKNNLQAAFGGGGTDAFITKVDTTQSGANSHLYSTFLGGNAFDAGHAIAIDATGDVYVAGATDSGTGSFPITSGAFDTTYNGGRDTFVAKINAAGSALVYSTYLGSSGFDPPRGIAVDAGGYAHVIGSASGVAANFPTQSAIQPLYAGNTDVYVTKFSPDGASLIYSTFLGGSGEDQGLDIALDSSGSAYITGYTGSADFPTASLDDTHNGSTDAFVAKIVPGTIDQQVTGQFSFGAGFGGLVGGSPRAIGQEFVPSLSRLAAVDLAISGGAPGDVKVEIRDGTFDGNIVGSVTQRVVYTVGDPPFTHFHFPQPLSLVPGQTYVIRVSDVSMGNPGALGISGNPYPQGRMLRNFAGNPPIGWDLMFRTYGFTPIPLSGCATLGVLGETYELTTSFAAPPGDCLRVTADNVTLDGGGNTVNFSSLVGRGVVTFGVSGLTVRKLTVDGGDTGIDIFSSPGTTLTGNTAINNAFGIRVSNSPGTAITGNTASDGGYGINAADSASVNVSNNTVTGNTNTGILIQRSPNSTVAKNVVSRNSEGILITQSSDTATVTHNQVSDNTTNGIRLRSTNGHRVTNNTVSGNQGNGILIGGNNTLVLRNQLLNNGRFGIEVASRTDGNRVIVNNFINNGLRAFFQE